MSEVKSHEVTIRPAEAGDVDALLALEEAAFAADRLERRAFHHAVRSPTIVSLVAVADEGLVGYVFIERRRNAGVARLTSIAVAPQVLGRGLGRRLLLSAEQAAARHGCRRLRLEVRADNGPAQSLYERTGYRRFETVEDYYEDGAAAWRYEKSLEAAASALAPHEKGQGNEG